MAEPIIIAATVQLVEELKHPRCVFSAAQVQADADDNWPADVDIAWIVERGAAQTQDRVWLGLNALLQHDRQLALLKIFEHFRQLVEPVARPDSAAQPLLQQLAVLLLNDPSRAEWGLLRRDAAEIAQLPMARPVSRQAAAFVLQVCQAVYDPSTARLSKLVRAVAALTHPLDLQAGYNLQRDIVVAVFRGRL